MKILIVDDEKLARARLRELITKIGEHTIVGEAINGSDAVEKNDAVESQLSTHGYPHAGDGRA